MTNQKQRRGRTPQHPRAGGQPFTMDDLPTYAIVTDADGSKRSFVFKGRHPLYDLQDIFESIEWEEIPFVPEAHRVPSHPPSRSPVPGCDCVGCIGRKPRNSGGAK